MPMFRQSPTRTFDYIMHMGVAAFTGTLVSYQLAVLVLTWVVPLQQIPTVEGSALRVTHLQPLLQQPLGDVALTDACSEVQNETVHKLEANQGLDVDSACDVMHF